MKSKDFIKSFSLILLSIVIIYLGFICYVDPQLTAPLSLSHKFQNYHDNVLLRKADLIASGNFDTVIIGSSTSEAFSVAEVNHYFDAKTFHASIGGGSAIARHMLFKKALKHFKPLKRVIYIADFFEFNKLATPETLSFNQSLKEEVPEKMLLPKFDYFKYLFSHQLLESSFLVIGRKGKGYVSPIKRDGTTSTSMILSTVETENAINAKIKSSNIKKLNEEIDENYFTYANNVLLGFAELNPNVKELYREMAKLSKDNNVELIMIMSPYHQKFKTKLLKNVNIQKRYEEWQQFLMQLSQDFGINLYNTLALNVATDPDSGVWRDGIHFNQFTASYFLANIATMKKK